MLRPERESGPEARHLRPAESISTAMPTAAEPSLRLSPDVLADLDALAENLRGRFVVQVTLDDDRRRTNVFRSAQAAERAVDRAKARGQRAHVTLCQMLPVGVVVMGGDRWATSLPAVAGRTE